MSTWSIVVPEAGHNLVTNPSLENNTTGYSPAGGGGTIARDTTDQRRGVACLKVMPAANGSDGCHYAITLTAGTTYAYSFDFKGKAGVPYRACLYDLVTLSVLGQQITFTGDDRWHRYEGVAMNGTHTNVCILVTKNGSTSIDSFYLDGMQVEQADHATTYIDGDQDGCTWLGPAHASASERSSQYRLGGRVRDIDSLASGITVQSFSGTGMPPVANLTQDRALLPGKTYCGTKVAERVLQLLILANGTSLENWHHLRRTLIDVVKPDAVSPQQPFLLRYSGAGPTVEIPVVYGGGLEQSEKSGFAEAIVLRLIAYDEPLWFEDGEVGAQLESGASLTVNHVVANIAGTWNSLANGANARIMSIATAADGSVYAGGDFTTIGGVSANHIAKWNGTSWSALASGLTDPVFCVACAADGIVYTCNLNGSVYGWNGSAWYRLGWAYGAPFTLAVASDGSLYVGGGFSQMNSVPCSALAKLSIDWSNLSEFGPPVSTTAIGTDISGIVVRLAFGPDGKLYAVGDFTVANGVTVNYVCYWNGSTFVPFGTGANAQVDALALGPDGSVYIGGEFTTVNGISCQHVARWNGAQWLPLGSGVNDGVYAMRVSPSGTVYASGLFTLAGWSPNTDRIAQWNGSLWFPLDIELPGSPDPRGIAFKGDDLYLGFDGAGAAGVSALTTVNVDSTTTTYPIITIARTGGTGAILTHLMNKTTGKVLYFNCPLSDGEVVTIDLRPNRKTITSNLFGSLPGRLLPNSNWGTWALQPGANTIALQVTKAGSATVNTSIRWRTTHWSAEGGAV
jgi:hypothetical protein